MHNMEPTNSWVGTLNLRGSRNQALVGVLAGTFRPVGAWLLTVLLPLACMAQYQYGISSHTVTNYTGYVLARDTGNAGRQAIRTRTVTVYSNPGSTPETLYFRLAYQLLDAGSLPVPM